MEYIKIIVIAISIIIIGYFIYTYFKSGSTNPSPKKINDIIEKSNSMNVLNVNNENNDYYTQILKLKKAYKLNLKNSVSKEDKEKIKNIFLNSEIYKNANNILINSKKTLKELEININLTNGKEKEDLQKSYNTLKKSIDFINDGINEILKEFN